MMRLVSPRRLPPPNPQNYPGYSRAGCLVRQIVGYKFQRSTSSSTALLSTVARPFIVSSPLRV
eukprot:3933096-Rhodomonas_salina.1